MIPAGRGQEGNYKFDNYGNQSMLLNGNVTGSATDLSLKWGQIVLGATYSRTTSPFEEGVDIPDDILDDGALDFVTNITFRRWRFIVGLKIPLLQGKLNEQSEE